MVAGRGIVRNYGRNNNSPATSTVRASTISCRQLLTTSLLRRNKPFISFFVLRNLSSSGGTTMTTRISVTVLTLAFAVCFAAGAQADRFSFSTGSPDGKLGALSRPSGQGLETET